MLLGNLGLTIDDTWPVGKHKGTKIDELETHYLNWVVFESNFKGPLLEKAKAELESRGNGLESLYFDPDMDATESDIW